MSETETKESSPGKPRGAGGPRSSRPRPREKRGAGAGGGALRIRLVRSGICTPRDQKQTLVALGFTRREQEVVRRDDASTRGMIRKVRHLVEVAGAER